MNDGDRVHLVGISGSGVKGLAWYFHACGYEVSGSDIRPGEEARRLGRSGVRVHAGHDARNLPADLGLVVRSRAVPESNPELVEATRRGITVETYSQTLGRLLRSHDGTGIGVAGTHGKTSTCAWLAWMLMTGDRDPSFIIGGDGEDFDGNTRVGGGREFVVEACEYGGSFHDIRPTLGVVLNVEDDHQECYGGVDGVRDAFGRFARTVPAAGKLLIDASLADQVAAWGVTARVIPVRVDGLAGGDAGQRASRGGACGQVGYRLEPPANRDGPAGCVLHRDGAPVVELSCSQPGAFSRRNMLFAAAVACEVGVDPGAIQRAAATFRGVRRRFQTLGTFRGVTLIDDYAHHPTEVAAVVPTTRREHPRRRLVVLFEPHQFRRLREYHAAFARELAGADRVIVTDVFAARERAGEWRAIGPHDLVAEIRAHHALASYVTLDSVVEVLATAVEAGDVVLALGAGRSSEVIHALACALS